MYNLYFIIHRIIILYYTIYYNIIYLTINNVLMFRIYIWGCMYKINLHSTRIRWNSFGHLKGRISNKCILLFFREIKYNNNNNIIQKPVPIECRKYLCYDKC
jgi:hypothetical protein